VLCVLWKNQDAKNECECVAEMSKVNMGSVEAGEISDKKYAR